MRPKLRPRGRQEAGTFNTLDGDQAHVTREVLMGNFVGEPEFNAKRGPRLKIQVSDLTNVNARILELVGTGSGGGLRFREDQEYGCVGCR